MRSLPLPTDTQADVFAMCLSGTTDPDLHARLTAITLTLASAGATYLQNATASALNVIPRVPSVGAVTKAELTGLYEAHLSKTNGAARAVYDRIRNAAPNNRCPLCGVGNVAHCDHHLPKSRYPDLAILPINLVPACHFCNYKKREKYPATAEQQTFHPYFDQHLLADNWVRATLNPGPPPVLVFDTAAPPTWPALDKDRVRRHFDACGLAITFTTNANDELPIIRDRLKLQAGRGGAQAVQEFLNEERDLHSQRPNSWQYATYRALAADVWFVSGGYLTIP
ncbi:HNH endonuclease [Roseibium aggregatum]|uniref:HNH endonuclease n=1 Tax=Roseibium aggregatum TaxID=187304 RepID=UPI001E47C690|nr:hypothetical protein [Roseibium aggregatum]UES48784.1 hypothetical protein GFK88_03675 [Roseibium aggregatum]